MHVWIGIVLKNPRPKIRPLEVNAKSLTTYRDPLNGLCALEKHGLTSKRGEQTELDIDPRHSRIDSQWSSAGTTKDPQWGITVPYLMIYARTYLPHHKSVPEAAWRCDSASAE